MNHRTVVCPTCQSRAVTVQGQCVRPASVIAGLVRPGEKVHVPRWYEFKCDNGHVFQADISERE